MGTFFENKVFQKLKFTNKVGLLDQILQKNDFENQNFLNFEEVVNNFARSEDKMIYWKNTSVLPCSTRSKNLQ